MGKYGTLSILEDLAQDNNTVIGREDAIARRFEEALAIHNRAFTDLVSDLCHITDQPELPYAANDEAMIDELDEWGAADASKAQAYGNVGFPLRIYGGTVQWTRTYFETASVSKLAADLDAFALADIMRFQSVVKAVLFKNTNTTSYIDRLQTKRTYALRALLNADGQSIPDGPSGASFDGSSHTHYLATATLTTASLSALIDTVVEHGIDGNMVVYIAKANETAVRQLTGFAPYLDARITVTGANQIGNASLDVNNPDNRAIGVYGGAEIWVKPWVPDNYQVAVDARATVKPLAVRTRNGSLTTGSGAFRILAENENFPLRARSIGREYGISAYGRHKAAVARSNNASYAIPS